MNNRIDARITALAAAIERRKLIQEMPVDALSQSLLDLADEFSQLDDLGKAALLKGLNRGDALEGATGLGLDEDALNEFIRDYEEKPHIVLGRSTK